MSASALRRLTGDTRLRVVNVQVASSRCPCRRGAVAFAAGFSAAVGVFFGFYPARKAARLAPIEALPYE